jgi:RND family efflux transporter MFP subunit
MKPVLSITTAARKRNMSRLLALSVVILLTGCGEKKHDTQLAASGPVAVVKGTVIETVKSAAVPETIEVVGTVRARTSAVVSTRIPGTISILRVREGDRVRKGQLLAQLDAQENQANAAVAVAGIDEAQRAVDESLSRKKLADTTFERYQRLFTEQAVTRQEFDIKQSERDLAQQGVARAEARLRQAREGSRAAAAMSDYTRIVSPISGIITSKQADLGATVFPAQPLMTIEDEGSYLLELAIPESVANRIKTGAAVQVSLDSVGAPFAAQIAELVPTADPGSRTFTAKINLSHKGLKSGIFGRGIISLGGTVTGMLVAKKAIIERGSLTSVWALDKDNIARMRLVKTGKTVGDRVEILSGLSDGERIVANGAEKVQEGSKVE